MATSEELAELHNGHILNDVYLPGEVLLNIFAYLDGKCLLKSRGVCQIWKCLIDQVVWKRKTPKFASAARAFKLTFRWETYYLVYKKNPFGRNLITNPYGVDGLEGWVLLRNGGNEWSVESPPVGANPLPESFGNVNSCFVTSYDACSKAQFIDLVGCGIAPEILDAIRPEFYISEWYCGRFDCFSFFKIDVSFFDAKKAKIGDGFHFSTTTDKGPEWQQVTTVLKDYPAGVRYIFYHHEGRDTQFWAGHYGSKMTGASVVCVFPSN